VFPFAAKGNYKSVFALFSFVAKPKEKPKKNLCFPYFILYLRKKIIKNYLLALLPFVET